jgi:hypothetical protein
MTNQSSQKLVLAFDVRPRRFGFVAFEGPNRLLDWGIHSFFSGPSGLPADKKVLTLINDFSPSVIVVRERQGQSDAKVLETLRQQAKERNIALSFISQKAIMKAFAGAEKNKHEVASALAQQFSILMSKLPRRQKCWQSEDYRMSIFDAAAVGVAYFTRRKQMPTSAKPAESPQPIL